VRAVGRHNENGAQRADAPYPQIEDLRSLVLTFAAHLLVQTGEVKNLKAAHQQAEACLDSGAPRAKWDEMLAAQGADIVAFNKKLARDHTARAVVELKATRTGYVSKCDARIISEAIRDLGGGRLTKESAINYDVGIDQLAKPGEAVKLGAVLCRIHAADRAQADVARARIKTAFTFSDAPPKTPPLIHEVI
jgi:thymidine phosphorylase